MRSVQEINASIKKDIIINGIMKSKGLYCLVSNPKVGKSMLALQLTDAVANNKQFLELDVFPSPVLYISTESDFSQLQERIELLELVFPENNLYITDCDSNGKITKEYLLNEIKLFSEQTHGKLVIIDMLKDIDFGFDYNINDYQDIGQKLLPELRMICNKYNVAILFTHHLNKRGTLLGSTAFDAVVDGKLTLIQNKNDKSLIRLNVVNRDFPELDIQLEKSENQVFRVVPELEDEIDFNLMLFIKYASEKVDFDFTCSEIVNKANILLTPKQFGRLLNSNINILEKEGIHITDCRTSSQRLYHSHYEEPIQN